MTVNSEDQTHQMNRCPSSKHVLQKHKAKRNTNNGFEGQLEATKPENTPRNDFLALNRNCDRRSSKISSRDAILPDKEFLPRNSLLTDLFEVKHNKALYNIFVVILIILFMSTAIHDIMETGTIHFGTKTIIKAFDKLPIVFYTWFGMIATTFLLYATFAFWAHKRLRFQPQSISLKIWDNGALLLFSLYQIALLIFPAKSVIEEVLPPASSFIVLLEQVRMMMKNHAFVRSNTPRVLAFKPHTESHGVFCPGFSNFLYFMFAPTLVYRDDYPRTKGIRWKVVVWSYLEVVLIIFYFAFIFERFFIPTFNQIGIQPDDPRIHVLNIFGNIIPWTLTLICGFYLFLQSWLNGSAELLQFADKMFYKDWWNSTSYSYYYRTWNIVVYDWLYTYIYKDMYEIIARKNKILSTLTVFLVSAIFHEYIIALAIRLFYPVLFMMFVGPGMFLAVIPKEITKFTGNIFFLLSLSTGTGIILSLYSMEFYARRNCAPYDNRILDLYLPRSWNCRKLSV